VSGVEDPLAPKSLALRLLLVPLLVHAPVFVVVQSLHLPPPLKLHPLTKSSYRTCRKT
jgi:hypothetical protein